MSLQRGNQLITALVVFGVLGIIVAGVGVYFWDRSNKVSPFNKRINEYAVTFAPASPQPAANPPGMPPGPNMPAPLSGGYIVGKVVPVDMKNKPEVDWIYFDLPDDLKAKKPEEVGTVVQLR